MTTPSTPAANAARLAETLRLATAIADEEARCHIECNCTSAHIGKSLWWDTAWQDETDPLDDYAFITIDTCVQYLELRGKIVRHPIRPHLVHFVERPADIAPPAA